MTTTIRRRALAITSAAVLAGALPLIASVGPAQADTSVQKTIDYSCDLFVSLTNKPTQPGAKPIVQDNAVNVGVTFTAPDLTRRETIDPAPVSVDLNLGKDDGTGRQLHVLAAKLLNGQLVT